VSAYSHHLSADTYNECIYNFSRALICDHILWYRHDGRCQCLQAAQRRIASCKSLKFLASMNKHLDVADGHWNQIEAFYWVRHIINKWENTINNTWRTINTTPSTPLITLELSDRYRLRKVELPPDRCDISQCDPPQSDISSIFVPINRHYRPIEGPPSLCRWWTGKMTW